MNQNPKGAPCNVSKTKKTQGAKISWKNLSTIFWDAQRIIFVDFFTREKSINSEAYLQARRKLRARIRRVRPNLKMNKILL